MLIKQTLLAVLFVGGSLSSANANQRFDTELALAQSVDNNYGLTEQSQRTVAVTTAKLKQGYLYDAERLYFGANAELAYRHYAADDAGLSNGEALELALNGRYLLTERKRVAWGMSTQTNQTTGDEYDEFLGFIGVRERNVDKRKIINSADLSYSDQLSEKIDVGATALVLDNRYLDADSTQLVDYEYAVTQAKLNVLVSENWSVFVTAEYSDFEPQPSRFLVQRLNAVESQSTSVLLGVAFQINENMQFSAAGGHRESEYSNEFRAKEKDRGRQIVIDASYQAETTKTTAILSEKVEPSASGSARLVRRFETRLVSSMSETLRSRFGVAYEQEEREFLASGSSREALVESSASLEKTISKHQRLGIKARYRRLLEGSDPDSVRLELFWRYQI